MWLKPELSTGQLSGNYFTWNTTDISTLLSILYTDNDRHKKPALTSLLNKEKGEKKEACKLILTVL